MIKKIFIFIFIIILSACSTKEINNISYNNCYKKNLDNKRINFSNKKQDFCLFILCTSYIDYNSDDFIYKTIKKANKKGIEGNTITNINLNKKEFNFLIFGYRFIVINGDIINNEKN